MVRNGTSVEAGTRRHLGEAISRVIAADRKFWQVSIDKGLIIHHLLLPEFLAARLSQATAAIDVLAGGFDLSSDNLVEVGLCQPNKGHHKPLERENYLRDKDPLLVLQVRLTSIPVLWLENEKSPDLKIELAYLEKYYGYHVSNDDLASDLLRDVWLAELDDPVADGAGADNPAAYNADHGQNSSNLD